MIIQLSVNTLHSLEKRKVFNTLLNSEVYKHEELPDQPRFFEEVQAYRLNTDKKTITVHGSFMIGYEIINIEVKKI